MARGSNLYGATRWDSEVEPAVKDPIIYVNDPYCAFLLGEDQAYTTEGDGCEDDIDTGAPSMIFHRL